MEVRVSDVTRVLVDRGLVDTTVVVTVRRGAAAVLIEVVRGVGAVLIRRVVVVVKDVGRVSRAVARGVGASTVVVVVECATARICRARRRTFLLGGVYLESSMRSLGQQAGLKFWVTGDGCQQSVPSPATQTIQTKVMRVQSGGEICLVTVLVLVEVAATLATVLYLVTVLSTSEVEMAAANEGPRR